MTGREFAASLLDESQYQLNACLDGLSEEQFAAKPVAELMSFRETFEHLTECCLAAQVIAEGGKYPWGTFKFPDAPMTDLIEIFNAERSKAQAAALSKFDEDTHVAKDFLIAHEFYHVGQLCIIRSTLNPEWDVYSIYRS